MMPKMGRLLALLSFFLVGHACAWQSGSLGNAAARTLYMQVGNGTGVYTSGTLSTNIVINKASIVVPLAVVGNGVAQVMTGNGQLNSSYDGFAFCPAGAVYIAAYYRRMNNAQSGTSTVSVTSPANLITISGDTIPFSHISWSNNSALPGTDFNPGVFGGTVVLGSVPANRWKESCFSYSYANTLYPAAGTYTGSATFTISSP